MLAFFVRDAGASRDGSSQPPLDPCPTSPTTAGPSTTAPGGGPGTLPKTGTDSRGLVVLGLALLLSGGAVVLTVHRGRRAEA